MTMVKPGSCAETSPRGRLCIRPSGHWGQHAVLIDSGAEKWGVECICPSDDRGIIPCPVHNDKCQHLFQKWMPIPAKVRVKGRATHRRECVLCQLNEFCKSNDSRKVPR